MHPTVQPILVPSPHIQAARAFPSRDCPDASPPLRRFTCPRGAYLDASPTPLAEKERRLQSHVRWLLQEGYEVMPGWQRGVKLAGNRMWTYSDPMWPKPPHCKGLWGVATAIQNNCVTVNAGRMLVSQQHNVLFRLVPKAGSTTIIQSAKKVLPGSLVVNYWVDFQGRCRPRVSPDLDGKLHSPYAGPQRRLLMANIREPMARFISGFNYFAARTGHSATNATDFVDVLRRGFECAHYAWGVYKWHVRGFMHLLPATGFFLLPHLLHAPENDTLPYVDKLFHLEEMGELLPYLKLVKIGAVRAAGAGNATITEKLVLSKEEVLVAKAHPHESSTEMFLRLLSQQPEIMRIFCRAFIQDYICFDYALPKECVDMIPPAPPALTNHLPSHPPSASVHETSGTTHSTVHRTGCDSCGCKAAPTWSLRWRETSATCRQSGGGGGINLKQPGTSSSHEGKVLLAPYQQHY
eukprot:jgi/Mesvir1/28606/Mv01020-RA.1